MANGKTEAQVQTAKKRKPSPRMKKTLKKMVENGGKSVSKAMEESGFSPAYSKNPQKLTSTKAWNELMDEFLPDDELMRVHKELLNAASIQKFEFPIYTKNSKIKEIVESVAGCVLNHIQKGASYKTAYYASPDSTTRNKAIAEAYKVKNKYKPQEVVVTNKLTKETFDRLRVVLGGA